MTLVGAIRGAAIAGAARARPPRDDGKAGLLGVNGVLVGIGYFRFRGGLAAVFWGFGLVTLRIPLLASALRPDGGPRGARSP